MKPSDLIKLTKKLNFTPFQTEACFFLHKLRKLRVHKPNADGAFCNPIESVSQTLSIPMNDIYRKKREVFTNDWMEQWGK
ncbi:CLUMA_CG000802, isoform A [Clunio marinus]|uniref:CLUMA_CG000802, isoform A n=1 Tax=Clunio marinus TaxID=568069 RepID=A0A1J1HG33_9DIPT|nr:CLUMA_CG000802, isoform A [Clunio marinus]